MNDHPTDPDLETAADLHARITRAVADLHSPDILSRAVAEGRRRRARRRVLTGAGTIAAVGALAIAGSAAAQYLDREPTSVAADPSPASSIPVPTSSPSASLPATNENCQAPGWWRLPQAEIEQRLDSLLPDGVALGSVDRRFDGLPGLWAGAVIDGDDADSLQFELLPPPGVLGSLEPLQATLDQTTQDGTCGYLHNRPAQDVEPCDALTSDACEEIRDDDGELVGVVTRRSDTSAPGHTEQAVRATLAVSGGGYVQLYVSTGSPADRPSTPQDPSDRPALTIEQARAIVTDPAWTT